MNESVDLYDVTIIGGGTTGLFAAFYCGMRGMTTKVIESKPTLGGKVTQFFPEKQIYDIGGIPTITGDALIEQMKEQATQHSPAMVTSQWIDEVRKNLDGTFTLLSTTGEKHLSKTIIVATGMGAFHVVGPERIDTTRIVNVNDSISHPKQFSDKCVVIHSNNRVGVDWAITLGDIADTVYLVNNKSTFQHASEEELSKLHQSNVKVRLNSKIKQFYESNDAIESITMSDEKDREEQVKVDHLLIYDGVKLTQTPFKKWGLTTDKGRIVVDLNMNTGVDGLFAAGDATIYDGKTMLIASGYTEAITAVNSAKKYINPKASGQVYSTVIYRND